MPLLRRILITLIQIGADEIQTLFGKGEGAGFFFLLRRSLKAIRTRKDGDEKRRIRILRRKLLDPVAHPVEAAAEKGFLIKCKMIKTVPFDHSFTIRNFRTDCNRNVP